MQEAADNQQNIENLQINVQVNNNKDGQINENEKADNQIISLLPLEQSNLQTSYRPDIDGLRAISVSLVVLSHAYQSKLPGGYIGCNVFFVISGFLITKILFKENMKDEFSYYNFYNRRVKRIFPAAIVVLLFVMFMVIRYADSQHMQNITRTMTASSIFAANLQIMTIKPDYANPKDYYTNPLLHFWSLGVEEQFYILWPLIISLIWKYFRHRAFHIIAICTVSSIILYIYEMINRNTSFGFYFTFCRFWQISFGGMLIAIPFKINNKYITQILSAIALIAIILCGFYSRYGFWDLISVISAGIIIQCGNDSFVNKYILGNPVMVFLGKISYSLYLWHWPLLMYSGFLYPQGRTILAEKWFILIIVIIISILSYFLVENTIRYRKEKAIFIALLVIMLSIGITSLYLYLNAGWIKPGTNNQQNKHLSLLRKFNHNPSNFLIFI